MLSEYIHYIQCRNIPRISCEHIQYSLTAGHLYSSFIIKITFSHIQKTSQDFQILVTRRFQVELNSSSSWAIALDEDLKDKDRNFFDTCSPNAFQLQTQLCVYDGFPALNALVGWCCELGWVFPGHSAPGMVEGTVVPACCWWHRLVPPWGATGEQRGWGLWWGTHWTHGNAAAAMCFGLFFPFKCKNILKVTISVTFPCLSSCWWWCSWQIEGKV